MLPWFPWLHYTVMFTSSFVHHAWCLLYRRLNNNEFTVLEATGIFKKLPQLRKMWVFPLYFNEYLWWMDQYKWPGVTKIYRSACSPCVFSLFVTGGLVSNLSSNKIGDIEEGTFDGASGVNEVILTSNRLENIHHSMLKGLTGLRTLWVQNTLTHNTHTSVRCFSGT